MATNTDNNNQNLEHATVREGQPKNVDLLMTQLPNAPETSSCSCLPHPSTQETSCPPHPPAVEARTRASEKDIPNLEHVTARDDQLKNVDLLLTQLPNAPESFSRVMKVTGTVDVDQTKPLKEGDGMVIEGRIAQYHHSPDPLDRVRGRGLSLVVNGIPAHSSVPLQRWQEEPKVSAPDVDQTKPSKEGDGVMIEGRIAQYHHCPDPSDGVRGRDLCLAVDRKTVKSAKPESNVATENGSDLFHTNLIGRLVLLYTGEQWIEGSIEQRIPSSTKGDPRWLILLENGKHTIGSKEEISRWMNCWSNPKLYFCTLTSIPAERKEGCSEEEDEGEDPGEHETSGIQALVACPRCGHSYCERNEWLSPFSPVTRTILGCGRTITPAGRRYCCNCGDYYRPPTPTNATRREGRNDIGSPESVEQMGIPPPPPPPISPLQENGFESQEQSPMITPNQTTSSGTDSANEYADLPGMGTVSESESDDTETEESEDESEDEAKAGANLAEMHVASVHLNHSKETSGRSDFESEKATELAASDLLGEEEVNNYCEDADDEEEEEARAETLPPHYQPRTRKARKDNSTSHRPRAQHGFASQEHTSHEESATESTEVARDFQNAWATEMGKLSSMPPPTQMPNHENESEVAESYAEEWFGAMCKAVKAAAKQTLDTPT